MAKDEGDFDAYVTSRWPRLVRSLVLLGCEAHEAEDVAQTALVRCYRRWDAVLRAADTDAYVYRVVLNTWRSSRRRQWWREEPREAVPELAPEGRRSLHDLDAVSRALGRLPSGQRSVLVLKFYADMSEKQIAYTLAIAPGTVKSRLSRGLAALAADPHIATLTGTEP